MAQPYPCPANICLLPRLDVTPQLPLPRTLTASQVPIRADLDEALASLASKPALLDAVANILAKTEAMRSLQPRTAQEPFMKMPDPTHPVYARMASRHPNLFNYFGAKPVDPPPLLPPAPVEKKASAASKSKEVKAKEAKVVKVEAPPPPAPPKPEPPLVAVENGLKVNEVKKKPQPKIPTAIIDPSLDVAQREAALATAKLRLEQLIRSLLEEVDGNEDLSRIDGLSSSSLRVKWKISMEGVKQISEEMLGAKSSGLIPQLPLPLIKDLLQALRVQCYKGREDLEYEHDPSSNLKACISLDAVTSMLYILSSQGMPTEVYSEDTLSSIILNIKHHLQRNVLVFYDKRLARQWRPQLLKEGQEGSEVKGGKAKGSKPQPSHDRPLPKHLPLVLGRLEQALQLLAETLSLVQMDTQALMPLLRVALQAFTLDPLHVFQVKVCSLSAAAFKYQPGVRGALLDEFITSILPTLQPLGAKNVPRHYLIQSVPGRSGVDGLGFTRGAAGGVVPIQMCVSLILQLVQSAAELSSIGSSSLTSPGLQAVRVAYEKCRAPSYWADRFWSCMMDKLPTARAAKADTSMDLKSFIEGVIQDLLAVSNLPEWPAASLLIRRLVGQLNSDKGLRHSEGSVRLMCVDFLGLIASRLVLDVKEASEEEAIVHSLLKKGLSAIEGVREGDDLDEEDVDKMIVDEQEEEEGEKEGSGKRRRRGQKEVAVGAKEKKQKVELTWPPHSTEVLQQLLINFLTQKHSPSSPSSSPSFLMETASCLIASQMLCDRLGEEIKAKRLDLMAPPPTANKAPPSEEESANHRNAEELIVLYRSLLSSPSVGRILTPPSIPLGSLAPALELSHAKKGGRGKGQSGHEALAPSHPKASYPLPSITREEAAAICRWLTANSALGKRRGMLLKWLVDAGDKTKQDGGGAANVRAKAIKCIGSAIDVDVRVLGLPDVQGAVRMALQDESVMVREAAVELIGRYISRSKELALDYFDVIKEATWDEGLSVRKRAVKVLWECCILCPGFPSQRQVEAVVLILSRAGDSEDSMRKLAASLCTELWFNPGSVLAEELLGSVGQSTGSNVDRSLRSRARQFAQVCSLTHESSGGTPNTLPSPDNAMFALIKTILLPGGVTGASTIDGEPSLQLTGAQVAARAGAKELATALVEWYLELHDSAIMDLRGSELQQLHCLTALHIIASVDASLCMPQSDPAKLIRCLAAYLKERQFDNGPSASGGSVSSTPQAPASSSSAATAVSADTIDLDRKRSAGRLLCIMHLITSVSRRLGHLDASLCDSAGLDLSLIITRHQFIGVTAGACQCLCALVRLRPGLAIRVQEIASRHYRFIDKEQAAGTLLTSKARFNFPRTLIVLGHLCRNGSEIIDGLGEMHSSGYPKSSHASGGSDLTGSTLSSQPVTLTQILSLFVALYDLPGEEGDAFAAKLKEYALQAMGLLLIARPDLILDYPGVMALFESALDTKSSHDIKRRALVNLTELLKAEEEGMFERQAMANSAMSKRNQASILPASALAPKPLARINGEGDAGSATSGVVQRLWKKVLLLTRDAPLVLCSEDQGGRVDGGALVRSRVLDLIEVVQRGGLTAPWQAVAPLVTLALDTTPETSHQAIKVLKQCVEKHSDFVGGELYPGLTQAYALQKNLWLASHPPSSRFGSQLLPQSVVEHLGLLYHSAIQPHAALKLKLLSGLTRPFEEATNAAGPGALNSDLGLLWFLCWASTHVPYKRMDEPLIVLSAIGSMIARRAEACMVELKDAIEEEEGKRKEQEAGPYPVSDRLIGAVKANIAMSLLYVTRQYIRQAYKLTDESRVAAYSGHQFLAFTPTSAAGEGEEGGGSPAPPSAPGPSPHLMSQSQAKKQEIKNLAVKDSKVEPPSLLTVIDLDAPASLSSSLKSATEAYKTIKYLMKEDTRLLTATSSAAGYEGMDLKGGQALSTPVTAGGAKVLKARPKTASTALAKVSKPIGKGSKRKKPSSDDEDNDEGDEFQEAAEVTRGSNTSTRSRVKAPRTN